MADLDPSVAEFNFCERKRIPHLNVVMVGPYQEARQMWLFVQAWLPTLLIGLTAAICFGVTSFVMGADKKYTRRF